MSVYLTTLRKQRTGKQFKNQNVEKSKIHSQSEYVVFEMFPSLLFFSCFLPIQIQTNIYINTYTSWWQQNCHIRYHVAHFSAYFFYFYFLQMRKSTFVLLSFISLFFFRRVVSSVFLLFFLHTDFSDRREIYRVSLMTCRAIA